MSGMFMVRLGEGYYLFESNQEEYNNHWME